MLLNRFGAIPGFCQKCVLHWEGEKLQIIGSPEGRHQMCPLNSFKGTRPVFQAIPSGEAATFACVISSPETSVLNVTWLHNGTSLPPTDARFSTSDLELTISNFSEDLAGNYTCVVANSIGIVSSNVAELQIACE